MLSRAIFKISDMHCTSCAINIDGELEDTKGVTSANTSYAKSITEVEFDPAKISPQQIVEKIKDSGYQATFID